MWGNFRTRYYDPETARFLSQDSVANLDPEDLSGLNLFVYCGNNPIMDFDPDGTWSWRQFGKVAAAIGIVIGITAAVAVGGFFVAGLVGVSAAAVATGAAIGGLTAGALEVGWQIAENGIDGMNLGAVAVETGAGALYGAFSGAVKTAANYSTRVAMRAGIVATGVLKQAALGMVNGDSTDDVLQNMGSSAFWGSVAQAAVGGMDIYHHLPVGYNQKDKLITMGIVIAKSIYSQHKDDIIGFASDWLNGLGIHWLDSQLST